MRMKINARIVGGGSLSLVCIVFVIRFFLTRAMNRDPRRALGGCCLGAIEFGWVDACLWRHARVCGPKKWVAERAPWRSQVQMNSKSIPCWVKCGYWNKSMRTYPMITHLRQLISHELIPPSSPSYPSPPLPFPPNPGPRSFPQAKHGGAAAGGPVVSRHLRAGGGVGDRPSSRRRVRLPPTRCAARTRIRPKRRRRSLEVVSRSERG